MSGRQNHRNWTDGTCEAPMSWSAGVVGHIRTYYGCEM